MFRSRHMLSHIGPICKYMKNDKEMLNLELGLVECGLEKKRVML